MALNPLKGFAYTRDWTKPADFPTFEDDETIVRADMQYQPDELKTFINNILVTFINTELIPLVNALVAGTIPQDSVYTAAIQKGSVTLEKLASDVTAKSLGAPDKVNGVAADSAGNIVITGNDIPVSPSDVTTIAGKLSAKQTETQRLAAEDSLADGDAFPFYDASENAHRKTLWSNILAKIRAAFKNSPLAIDSGGTNGKTAAEARANLGALSSAAGSVGTSNLGDKVVTAAKIADKAVTAAKLAADAVKLTFTNKSVAASAFVSNSTYSDFPYRAAVTLTGVTAAMVPEVFFGLTDAMSGNFAPVAESYAGGIYIYAAAKPSATITIPTILCWR